MYMKPSSPFPRNDANLFLRRSLGNPTRSTILYYLHNNRWHTLDNSLNVNLISAKSLILNNLTYMFGMYKPPGQPAITKAYRFNQFTGYWRELASPLYTFNSSVRVITHNDTILMIGGLYSSYFWLYLSYFHLNFSYFRLYSSYFWLYFSYFHLNFQLFQTIFQLFLVIFQLFPSKFQLFQTIFQLFLVIFQLFPSKFQLFQTIFQLFLVIFQLFPSKFQLFQTIFQLFQAKSSYFMAKFQLFPALL